MRKFILLNLFLLLINTCFSQSNPRPTRSRFYNSNMSTFTIQSGDILLYTAKIDSIDYDIVVTVAKYGSTISFDYNIPKMPQTGNVLIESSAVNNAVIYDTLLHAGTKDFKDTSIFWLSKKNYTDLAAANETTMDIGNGNETFVKHGTSTLKINYKGKEKIVTAFAIENKNEKSKKRGFWF